MASKRGIWAVWCAPHEESEWWVLADVRTREDDANLLAQALKDSLQCTVAVQALQLDSSQLPQAATDTLYKAGAYAGRTWADPVESLTPGYTDDPAWMHQGEFCELGTFNRNGTLSAHGLQWGADEEDAKARFLARAEQAGYGPAEGQPDDGE